MPLFTLTSCNHDELWEEDRPPITADPLDERLLEAFTVPMDEPNSYSVRINWTVPDSIRDFQITRISQKGITTPFPSPASLSGFLLDPNVEAGSVYVYQLAASDSTVLASREVTVPLDRVLDGTVTLRSQTLNGRLFLSSNTHIYTEGEPLLLEVHEIISDGATIHTFRATSVAPAGKDGRDAGDILIAARSARGRLRIEPFGQDGGPGIPGQPGAGGKSGDAGSAAVIGVDPDLEGKVPDRNLKILKRQLADRVAPANHEMWRRKGIYGPIYECIVPPTDGTSGAEGAPGLDGGNGGRGGSSAAVAVTIHSDSGFAVDVVERVAQGGIAAPGGQGGAGGPGGSAGEIDWLSLCPAAKNGASGNAGPTGKSGVPGLPGNLKPFCIKVGERRIGQC